MDTQQTPVMRPEFSEFKERVAEHGKRTNERLSALEKSAEQINSLCISVERLATNMEHMLAEQKEQGAKLEKLEDKDGDMWRKVISHTVTAIISIVVAYAFAKLGM